VQLQDGLSVEAVIMTYAGYGSSENGCSKSRATVCVSSEVGCQMGCTFCATGTMGLIAELTCGEIVEQLVHANLVKCVRNVVFMGMGEPLNNYNAVAAAIRLMIHPQIFALKQRSITVSTVGVVHRLASLARDLPGVSLALSLHAPNQQLRRLIVPSAQAFKLDKLLAAVDAYMAATGNRVFIESASARALLPHFSFRVLCLSSVTLCRRYVLLGPDFNCLESHAHELGQLLRGRDVSVNLIPWNPVLSPDFDFRAPPAGTAFMFQSVLKQYALACTVRQEKGQDVAAACGQLVLQQQVLEATLPSAPLVA
jgi:adenine C2-methylase RlmN of 23S rRNA A2503 and tRNA A37